MLRKILKSGIMFNLLIFLSAQMNSGTSQEQVGMSCTGSSDPICFLHTKPPMPFMDISELSSSEEERPLEEPYELLVPDQGLRAKRGNSKKKRKKAKAVDYEMDEAEVGKGRSENVPPTTTTESPPNPQQLFLTPLKESEMSQNILKQYSNDSMATFYPPWTYHGFYPPHEWHEIPGWYFKKREVHKAGKFTGRRGDKSSGISFMEFAEGNGTHSLNCSNSLFPSPLDIVTGNAREESNFVEFNFVNFDTLYPFTIFLPEDGTDLLFIKLITGKASQISNKPSIDKGATTGTPLSLDRILVHYGVSHTEGSEHRINGKSYGMEIQFFFNKQTKEKASSYWATLESYMTDKDSSVFGKNLLVLSILVQVAPNTEKFPPAGKEYNQGMKYLSTAAKEFWSTRNSAKNRGFKVLKKSLSLRDFFQVPITGFYYSYYGSLTHPPCLNNTRYAVFETPIYISHEMWRNFLFIPSEFSDSQFVAGNHRPLETLTGRSSYTGEVLPYEELRWNLSFTVRKSKRGTREERMLDYDYYEHPNISLNLPTQTNSAGTAATKQTSLLTFTLVLFTFHPRDLFSY